VDDHAAGMIRLKDGGTVWIERSKAVNMDDKSGGTEIYGSKGGLKGHTLYTADAEGKRVETRLEVEPDIPRSTHMLPPTAFVNAILEGRSQVPDCSGEEGLFVQRIMNAMLESAQQGREIVMA
jgi:predicted dehydrogenase